MIKRYRYTSSLFCRFSGHAVLFRKCSTVAAIYNTILKKFTENNVKEPEESARYLISHVANIEYRMSVFGSSGGKVLSSQQIEELGKCVSRRLAREPIQYIIGNWDFYGFTVTCIPPVLIPRPETEELVERILAADVLNRTQRPRILDIGCGSGVIGIALLSQLPQATCVAIDIDPIAVDLTRENITTVLCGNCSKTTNTLPTYECCRHEVILTSIAQFSANEKNFGQFDIIVSNPPYIPSADISALEPEVNEYESRRALDGGESGMDVVKEIIHSTGKLLSAGGTRELWMEVSHSHPAVIRKLMGDHGGDFDDIEDSTAVLQPDREDDRCGGDSGGSYGRSASNVVNSGGISGGNSYRYQFVEGIADGYGQPRYVRLRLSQ